MLPSTPLRTNVLEVGANFCFPWILHFSWPNKPSFDTNKPSFGTNMSSFGTNKPALESRKMLRNIKKIYFESCMAFIFLFIHLFTRRTFRQL